MELRFRHQYFDHLELFSVLNTCNHLSYTDFSTRAPSKSLLFIFLFLKIDWQHQFKLCIDLIAYDRPGKKYRFTLIYYFLSLVYNTRYQVLTQLPPLKGVSTAYMLYKSINWSEREV